jgi:hypothetical protein
MAHNKSTKLPKEEQKIDSFLDSLTEKTYDSVHANCTMNLLEGNLTFAKVIKLYTHRCFQRYPHFQVDDLDTTPKIAINKSTHVHHNLRNSHDKGCGYHNNGRDRGSTRSHGSRSHQPSSSSQKTTGSTRSNGSRSHHSSSSSRVNDRCLTRQRPTKRKGERKVTLHRLRPMHS